MNTESTTNSTLPVWIIRGAPLGDENGWQIIERRIQAETVEDACRIYDAEFGLE